MRTARLRDGRASDPLVTVTDLVAGPLRAATLDVARAADGPNMLGMDVLGQHRCVFRLDAGVVPRAPGRRSRPLGGELDA
jgi:hypothetical protein